MYGENGRIGLVLPSSNTTMEMEFHKVLPHGISLHTSRMPLTAVTHETLHTMHAAAYDAAILLKDAQVDIVLYGCTSGSFIEGTAYAKKIERRLAQKVGIPIITTISAVVNALKVLNAQKIVLITPYIDKITQKEKIFLESDGIDVLKAWGMGIVDNIVIGKQRPEYVYKIAKNEIMEKADALFISCTNLRTFETIELLEGEIAVPVVTSNQASLWATLQTLGYSQPIQGLGDLLRVLPSRKDSREHRKV